MEAKYISNKLKLISPIPPTVNHYLSWRAIVKNGKPLAISYESREYKDYKKFFVPYVKVEMKRQNFNPVTDRFQFVHVDTICYFPKTNIDSNNIWKVVLDCLTDSGLYPDDNIVLESCKRVYYDTKNPRIELEIYCSDNIGIFDNQSHLDNFISKCVQCARYKNGKCSIINKALESRIQEEIISFQCIKFKKIKK